MSSVNELRQLPGVVSVGVVSKLPLDGDTPLAPVSIEGQPTPPGTMAAVYPFPVVSADYFRTMDIGVVAGRVSRGVGSSVGE